MNKPDNDYIHHWAQHIVNYVNADTESTEDLCAQAVLIIAQRLIATGSQEHHVTVLRDIWNSAELKARLRQVVDE